MEAQSTPSCSWCGIELERGDGWRVRDIPGARRAAFCRLEHIVPWSIQGARWEGGEIESADELDGDLDSCAQCGAALADARVVAVRHRGPHRIPDAFCSAGHLADWAKSGGRWR